MYIWNEYVLLCYLNLFIILNFIITHILLILMYLVIYFPL